MEPSLSFLEAGPDIVVVRLVGDADLAVEGDLTTAIRRVLNRDAHVIVDISDATFIHAAVVRSLIGGYNEATAQGSSLVVQLGSAGIVGRVITMTGIEHILSCAGTRDEAVWMIKTRRNGTGMPAIRWMQQRGGRLE